MKKQIGFVLALVVLAAALGFMVVSAMGDRAEAAAPMPENGFSVTLEHCETDGWTAVVVLRLDLPETVNVDLKQMEYLFAYAMLGGNGGDESGSWTTLRQNNTHSVTIQYRCDRMCPEPVFAAEDTYQLYLNNLIEVPNEPPHAPTTLLEGEWVVDLTFDRKDTQEKQALIPNQTELPAKRLSGETVTIFLTDYQIKPYGVVLGYTFDQNTTPEAVELMGEVKLRMEDQSEILCTPSMNGIEGNTGEVMFQLQTPIHPNQVQALLVGDVEISVRR